MPTLQTCITKGHAYVKPEGLRCGAPREKDPSRPCNKLLCKRNEAGQMAGNFRCERCSQEIEVVLAATEMSAAAGKIGPRAVSMPPARLAA